MITKIYIFSYTDNIFRLYINDENIFINNVCKNAPKGRQIAIHRDGGLMYYIYTNKISENNLYGICIVNSQICTDIKELFNCFNNILSNEAKKGRVFKYDDNGVIKLSVIDFATIQGDIETFFSYIKAYFDKKETKLWKYLPTENFSISKNTKVSFSLDEDASSKITDAIGRYNNIYITTKNINPSSWAVKIQEISKISDNRLEQLNLLQKDYDKLKHQKKQTTAVIIFIILLFLSLVILYLVSKDKNSHISSLNGEIAEYIEQLANKDERINYLNDSLETTKEELNRYSSVMNKIIHHSPLIITSIKFDNSTGYLTFNYIGLKDTTMDVDVSICRYNMDPYFHRNKEQRIHVNESKTDSVKIYMGRNSSYDFYNILIASNGKILGREIW